MDVLESFSDSRFFLVGDSGEQDMELYASIAKTHQQQILGIFIRDASVPDVPPLDDPTGANVALVMPGLQRRGTQSLPSSSNPSPVTPSVNGRIPGATHHPTRSMSGSEVPTPRGSTYATRVPKRTKTDLQGPPSHSVPSGYFVSTSLLDSPVCEEPQPIPSPILNVAPTSYPPLGFRSVNRRQDDDASSTSSRISLGRGSTASSFRTAPMTDGERKQYDLQARVYKARADIPASIPLRVFREPSECIEVAQILDDLKLGRPQA